MTLDETFLVDGSVAPRFSAGHIQLAKFQSHSYVAGPGRRCVVWVSGCRRRCPGCFQSQFFDFEGGNRTSVDELADRILNVSGIDGVSLSGGEPFEQSVAIAQLCQRIKAESPLSILAYTGYRRETLVKDACQHGPLLELLDILIDGEYRQELRGPYLWRGSANQRIHIMQENAEVPAIARAEPPGTEEIQVALSENEIVLTGFPGPDVHRRLRRALKSRGIVLDQSDSK